VAFAICASIFGIWYFSGSRIVGFFHHRSISARCCRGAFHADDGSGIRRRGGRSKMRLILLLQCVKAVWPDPDFHLWMKKMMQHRGGQGCGIHTNHGNEGKPRGSIRTSSSRPEAPLHTPNPKNTRDSHIWQRVRHPLWPPAQIFNRQHLVLFRPRIASRNAVHSPPLQCFRLPHPSPRHPTV